MVYFASYHASLARKFQARTSTTFPEPFELSILNLPFARGLHRLATCETAVMAELLAGSALA